MKTLVTLSTFAQFSQKPLKRLQESGFEVVLNSLGRKLTHEESLQYYASDIDGVIAGTEQISADILERAESLKVISRCGVGLDNVDLKAAQKEKITVFSTAFSVADAVAELTLGLILNCLRGISHTDRALRTGQWHRPMGYLLKDKTLGVIGVGQVGKKVIELVKGFNVNILAYDAAPDKKFFSKNKVKPATLEKLLNKSDVVTIHLPLSEETRRIMNLGRLNLMHEHSFLVNTSRGEIIDEQALYEILKAKKIAGAALDVFHEEPYAGPLKELDNVVLTAHIGSYARETRINMELEAVENLIKGLKHLKNSKRIPKRRR